MKAMPQELRRSLQSRLGALRERLASGDGKNLLPEVNTLAGEIERWDRLFELREERRCP
jgi:hypothetical protein